MGLRIRFLAGLLMGCQMGYTMGHPMGHAMGHPMNTLVDVLYRGHPVGCWGSHEKSQVTAVCCCVACRPLGRSAFYRFIVSIYRIIEIVIEIPNLFRFDIFFVSRDLSKLSVQYSALVAMGDGVG